MFLMDPDIGWVIAARIVQGAATGAATALSTMNTALPMSGMPVIVDFNPMADKLRLMTGTTNHRVDVDTGAGFVTPDNYAAVADLATEGLR